MGGVDLIDCFISYYWISMRTKQWTVRRFAEFLDMACCNGWIEYMRMCEQNMTPKQQRLDLLEFNMNIAVTLIQAETQRCKNQERTRQKVRQNRRKKVDHRGAGSFLCPRMT